MEVTCLWTVESLCTRATYISYAIAVLVLGITIYIEGLDGLKNAINVFPFPDLSPSVGSEAALLARRCHAILGGGALTSFADTSLLLTNKLVEPFTSWEEAEKQLEAWGGVLTRLPGRRGRTTRHIRGMQPRLRNCLHQGKTLSADALEAYFTRRSPMLPPDGIQTRVSVRRWSGDSGSAGQISRGSGATSLPETFVRRALPSQGTSLPMRQLRGPYQRALTPPQP